MDYNVITQLVGSLGFPILACTALFWDNRETRKDHKAEVEKLAQVIEANTASIAKLGEMEDN